MASFKMDPLQEKATATEEIIQHEVCLKWNSHGWNVEKNVSVSRITNIEYIVKVTKTMTGFSYPYP